MNKKFFTLMAVAGLAGSVAVNAVTPEKVTTFPTAAGNTEIKAGDIVRLDFGNPGWQIDFTGAPTADSKKDSLLMLSGGIAGRSKAHIDSLLFNVDYEKKSLDYDGTPTFEYSFTFTSKVGKFAFAKPEAKKIKGAYLNTNGALNKWVLPAAYLTATTDTYVPFVVATREADSDKPKTVYVLAYTSDASMKFTVMEINYSADLEAAASKIGIIVDATTGIGTLGTAGTYTAYRFAGWEVSSLDLTVEAANIEDALGYANPSFKFDKAVSAEEENLLAAYNWDYTADGYLKAIGAKQAVTGRDLYLTVDTAFYDVANERNFKLALDTLPDADYATDKMIRNAEAYKFEIKASFVKDSITISTTNTPKTQANGFFKKADGCIDVANPAAPEAIIIKKFGNKTALTTQYVGDKTSTPCITASEFPTKELNDENVAQFTSGHVYTIFDMNKFKANGKTANPDYGKALIIDNMRALNTQLFVKAEKFDNTLPSHQWVAQKKDNINVYTFKNRETNADVYVNDESTKLTDVQLFVVDADKFLYTYGDRKDTIKLEKLDQTKLTAFDGFQHITRQDQRNKVFNLRFVSELLGDEAFVQQNADSVMNVAIGNKANAVDIRFLNYSNDTLKLGDANNYLTAVPYAVKVGRYFLAYDVDKKVYRFTEKQGNEAEGENYGIHTAFLITKLVGGNIALVPAKDRLNDYYGSSTKLAIDSETGKAVRVLLGSDLRHAFELTSPADAIFAQVLPKADTTLVTVNFNSVENANWKLAKGADNFLYEGVPTTLKAGGAEYAKEAFDFQLDTAYVQRAGNTMPMYYITQGAVRGDSTFVAHNHNAPNHVCPPLAVNDTVSGKFLFVMSDSLDISRANDQKYGYIYNYGTFAKLQMVDAKHINDTLIVNAGRVTPLASDTIKANEISATTTDPAYHQYNWINRGNEALFAFRVNMDNKDEYAIYNPATGMYITYLNGFVVASYDAAFYTLKDDKGFNVGNEEITSASTVSVIAKAGAVEISGAQGKKVTICNILGQTIANTVITSDNATIAAPAGIVVVAVEGEEAVKAIVK